VQNTHKNRQLLELHRSLLDLMSVLNRPQGDDILIREAGISLDRALFPLLVRIERLGPIGIVDLADRAGRDHTTVSRQVAKLESLKLVTRRASPADGRVREALIARKGKAMVRAVDAARERLSAPILATWSDRDFDELVRLMRRFVDDLLAGPAGRGLQHPSSQRPGL
jgi:DNA-binding MarR family transcriptional regulator